MEPFIPVLYCINTSFVVPFSVSLSSLLASSPLAKVFVLTLPTEELNVKNELAKYLDQKIIAELNIIEAPVESESKLPENWSKIGYLRLLAPQLFLQFKKMIYLDADTLVLRNISELWDVEIETFMFGAARDSDCPDFAYDHQLFLNWGIEKGPYFNSGVMLLNLDLMRLSNFTNQVLDLLKDRRKMRFTFGDQDAMNVLYHSKWKEIKPHWNVINHARETLFYCKAKEEFDPAYISSLKDAYTNPAIVHFAGGVNPWTFGTPTKWGAKWNEVRQRIISNEVFDKWRSHFMATTLWKLAQFTFSDSLTVLKDAISLIHKSSFDKNDL